MLVLGGWDRGCEEVQVPEFVGTVVHPEHAHVTPLPNSLWSCDIRT